MSVDLSRVKEIFLAAVDQAPAERKGFVERACAADAELFGRVSDLLLAHEQDTGILVRPRDPQSETRPETPDELVAKSRPQQRSDDADLQGQLIAGRFKLLQKLGEGGMGEVWMAEQREPVKRLVAFKIIKTGRDTQQTLMRFEAERQALALMDHPNIAKVLDGGTTEAGQPYFVMELVKGIPITKYCDQEHLTPRQRLELFIPVCQAVQHAHQKGVIHRDLKPSNILIALYDGKAVPKVIDFGIAKAISHKLTDQTMYTEVGQIVGTLEYMPPEQAELNNLDIDTRADVYSLGVVLYELLTGATPFTARQLRDAGILEMLRIIREVEPQKPSTKISSSETSPAVAANRKLEAKRLSSLVAGDLDWIVMKCLEKERARRYDTAKGLALDIQRYLANEPVEASPPGAGYRLRKFVRRNRVPVLASLLVLLALVGGVIGTTLGLLHARLEKQRADEQAQNALRQESIAREQSAEAVRQTGIAKENEDEARKQSEEAGRQARIAKENEARTKRQEELTDKERQRAEDRAADARRELDQSRRSLLTAQLWRVAGLLEHEPMLALTHLEDQNACPPDLRDFAWRYFRGLYTSWKPAQLPGHRGNVQAVAVRKDGKMMASASVGMDACIKLWDLETRKELATLREHKGDVQCLAFSPDGALLASGGTDKTVKLWDVDKKQVIATLDGHNGPVSDLSFSADGNWLVSNSMVYDPIADKKNSDTRFNKGEVQLWNVAKRTRERRLYSIAVTGILCVSFAPDGKTVAIGTSNVSDLRLIDVATGKAIDKYTKGAGWVEHVAYSPDGQTVAWASAQQLIYLLDVEGKQTRLTLRGHQGDVDCLAWSPDGKTLASGSSDAVIKLWNPATGKERLTLRGGVGRIHSIAFTPDGNTLVAAQGKQIVIWDLVPRTSAATYSATKGFRGVALSGDDKLLAAPLSGERKLRLQNISSGKERTLNLATGSGTTVAFAPKGGLLAVGMHGWEEKGLTLKTPLPTGECQLWNTSGDRKVATLKTKTQSAITALAFTPDGRWLLTGDKDGEVLLWDVTDPEKPKEGVLLGKHVGAVSALALSADGQALATGAFGSIKLWNVAERRERTALSGHERWVTGLAFLDDGKALASTGLDRSVRIWDLATGKERFALPIQPHFIHSLAVSKDGNTLALACHDRTIKLWDLPSRQLRAVLLGHTREVNAVTFSHDGKLLLSASAPVSHWFVTSGEIKVWKGGE
jgi:eukaryotic-like serine/threonine-protein kinase